MNYKISRAEMYFEICGALSKRSSCMRGKVGAVIVNKDHRILSTGYNDKVKGLFDCSTANCVIEETCSDSIHAEANAIINAARFGIKVDKTIIWCTTAPCLKCAQMIINAGIIEVNYHTGYRNTEGLDLLEKCKIKVIRHEHKESV